MKIPLRRKKMPESKNLDLLREERSILHNTEKSHSQTRLGKHMKLFQSPKDQYLKNFKVPKDPVVEKFQSFIDQWLVCKTAKHVIIFADEHRLNGYLDEIRDAN